MEILDRLLSKPGNLRSLGRRGCQSYCLLFLTLSSPVYAEGNKIRVALFVDGGTESSAFTKEFRRSDDNELSYQKVDGDEIRHGTLSDFDALVVPGGSASKESASLGAEAREEICRFVKDGGIYMGVCAGAYLASRQRKNDLGLLPLTTLDNDHWFRVTDGTLVDVELTPAGMEIFGIPRRNIKLVYENGPIFAPPVEPPDDSLTPLGFFRSEVVARGGERGVMLGAPAIILARYGRGIVLVLSPHPEETPGLKKVKVHALHWLCDHRSQSAMAEILSKGKTFSGHSTARISEPQSVREQSSEGLSSHPEQLPSVNTNLNEQALKLAKSTFDRANVVRYLHRQVPASRQIIDQDGLVDARTDCSGFISFIVHSIAPRHYQVVRLRESQASYPQAKIWARFFDTLNSNRPRDGWLGISDWHNLRPGDFIAWQEGKSASGNTGHVMLVADRPSDIKQENGVRYIEVSVIDSSSVYHFSPEHLPPNAHQQHRDGLGAGSVRIVLSGADAPIGYWEGTYWGEGRRRISEPTLSKTVRFARMMSLQE